MLSFLYFFLNETAMQAPAIYLDNPRFLDFDLDGARELVLDRRFAPDPAENLLCFDGVGERREPLRFPEVDLLMVDLVSTSRLCSHLASLIALGSSMHTATRGARAWLLVRSRGPILDACSVARLSVMFSCAWIPSLCSALSPALSTTSYGNERYITMASLATSRNDSPSMVGH